MMAQRWKHENITTVAGMDARGFILATSIADRLNCGMVMLRKPSKLPNTIKVSYSLEYGTNTLEIQRGAIGQGDRVLIVDDLLATGGTAKAACELVE
jgi:adenine phosphoribosyltransferase